MPKPYSKPMIIEKLRTERRRLERNLSQIKPDDMLIPGVVGKWTVKDVLAHLADWEAHMPVWIEAARSGEPVSEIEAGLQWGQYDEFNQRIYTRHKDQPPDDVLAYFRETHSKFMEMVETMPEDEMLTLRRYAFLGKDSVAGWLSLYAAHDRWAKVRIRKWMKSKR